MPSLFKRSNGIYYAVISDDAGGRRWVSTGETRKVPALKQLVSISAAPPHARIKKKRILEFFDELKEFGDTVYSKENPAIYQRAFDNFIPCVGNVLMDSVTPRQIDYFKAARLKSVKPVTVSLELRTLASIRTNQRQLGNDQEMKVLNEMNELEDIEQNDEGLAS